MIRVGLIAVIGTCAFVLGLFFIDRNAGAQYGASQSSAPLSLEQEIKRVEAQIDKIFADTLAQLPAIPRGTAHRMKRVQALGKLELFDKQLSVNRNTACTFFTCQTLILPDRSRCSMRQQLPIRDRFEMYRRTRHSRDTATGNRRVTLTHRTILSSSTTRSREISMEGTFGICEPLATSCRIQRRSKRKTRQSTLTRWASRTPLVLC